MMFITTDNSDRITTGHIHRRLQTIVRKRQHCLRISHSIIWKMNCHKSTISCCRTKATPIVGIPKHGRPAIVTACRSINLLNSDSKIFARIVAKRPFTQVQVVLHHAVSVVRSAVPSSMLRPEYGTLLQVSNWPSTSLHRISGLPGGLRQCIARLPSLYLRKVQEGSHSLKFTLFLLP